MKKTHDIDADCARRWPGLVGLLCVVVLAGCGPDGAGNNGPGDPWQPAFDAADKGWLLSVAGASRNDIYAVGGRPDDGRIWHFDGSDWAAQSLPGGVDLLNWVHVFDDGDPVVAGDAGTIARRVDGAWQLEQTPTDQDLWGVWGINSANVWAVGGNGRDAGAATILHKRDGHWEELAVPELEHPNVRAFYKVWGSAVDNVYMVGQRGAVVHWDGQQLSEVLVGTGKDLVSLWGRSADDIVIVGGRSNGVLVHFDGHQWTPQQLAPLPGINGVWVGDDGAGWVAGNHGTLGRLDVDTPTGAPEVAAVAVDTSLDLHAVFGFGDGAAMSVGGSFQSQQPPYHGVALERGMRR